MVFTQNRLNGAITLNDGVDKRAFSERENV